MARRLASLLVEIEANTASLSRDTNRAVGIVNSTAKRMTSAMDTVRRSFVGIVSVVAIQRAFKAIISASAESEAAMRQLEAAGETVWRIGSIVQRQEGQAQTVVL